MGHKEGWARIVNATPRVQPERLTARKHTALSPSRKAKYDKQRRDWHANMGVLRTPQLRGLHDTLWDIVDSNLHDNDRAKGAVAIEGAAGLGKSTAVEQFAKEFHLREGPGADVAGIRAAIDPAALEFSTHVGRPRRRDAPGELPGQFR
jgi:hypothetical protein